jgi:hypothetical protein
MIMLGLKFAGDVPFREVYVHGLIRDAEGQKMSKSKGNVIDPLDIVDGIALDALLAKRTTGLMQPHLAPAIDKATRRQFPEGIAACGTDALRFTFAALATQSRDIRFDLARVAGNRNFCNKLWNAARFVTLVLEQSADVAAEGPQTLSVADRWIRSRLGTAIGAVDTAFAEYRFDYAATALYEFCWHEYCDNFRLVKPVLQGADIRRARRARHLIAVLEAALCALPLMPFITEVLAHCAARRRGPGIMLSACRMRPPPPTPWPVGDRLARGGCARRAADPRRDGHRPARRLPLLLQHAGARELAAARAAAVEARRARERARARCRRARTAVRGRDRRRAGAAGADGRAHRSEGRTRAPRQARTEDRGGDQQGTRQAWQ